MTKRKIINNKKYSAAECKKFCGTVYVTQSDSGGYERLLVLRFAKPWLDQCGAESALPHD